MRAANHLYVAVILLGSSLLSCADKKGKEKDEELSAITSVVASYSSLPTCSAETLSRVYWIDDQEKLVVCNGSSFVEITGGKGEKGDAGSQGEKGETGAAGSPANSGVWVFDRDAKPIGVLMDARLGLILFTNGGFARINLETGDYSLPAVLDNGAIGAAPLYVCASTDTVCGGTCYVESDLPKGSILRTSASTFVVANGDEALVNGVTVKRFSEPDGATCTDIFGMDVSINAYPITKQYSFPDGISLPLNTPLSYGFKTAE